VLAGLYAGALEDAELREKNLSRSRLESIVSDQTRSIDVLNALAPSNHMKVIAEIKRASPSRGKLGEIEDPAALASAYQSAGASAISVLTEQRAFLGSLDDLAQVRAGVLLPLLRKDFISTEYQILEARAFGADMILLIVAGLPGSRLVELKAFAEKLGLQVLVETHTDEEVRFAVDIGCAIIGINARDLSTFETDRSLFETLCHLIPAQTIKIAESAVRTVEDVRQYRDAGANVVLVGEALVTGDASSLIRQFTSV
jgi:indole-3-glycerol phosphate synthase